MMTKGEYEQALEHATTFIEGHFNDLLSNLPEGVSAEDAVSEVLDGFLGNNPAQAVFEKWRTQSLAWEMSAGTDIGRHLEPEIRGLKIQGLLKGMLLAFQATNIIPDFELLPFIRQQIHDCSDKEFQDALATIEDSTDEKLALLRTFNGIKERYPCADDETVSETVKRAAAAGDPDAIVLLPQLGTLRI
jgi:hypothetical protein